MNKLHSLGSLALVVSLVTWAYSETDSGPVSGATISPLKVTAVAGLANGEKNFAAERKTQPTVYVFVQADRFDRPIARFLKSLNQQLARDRSDVQMVAVWLTEDVVKSKEYLPLAQKSTQLEQTVWTVFEGEKSGPAGWNVDVAANVTVVVADGETVVKSWGYGSINESVVREVYAKLPTKK